MKRIIFTFLVIQLVLSCTIKKEEAKKPNVKKIARFETKSNSDEGVESVLEELLKTPSSTSLNV